MARLERDNTQPITSTPSQTPSLLSIRKPTKVNEHSCMRIMKLSPQTKGRLLALIGAILTGLNLTGVKYLYNQQFPAPQALISRYTPSLIIVIFIGTWIKIMHKDTEWHLFANNLSAFKMLSIRSLFHWISNMSMIYSLLFIPIMLNISIFYIWSIFAIILSHFFLNERADAGDILLSLIGFGGVVIMTDPNFESFARLNDTYFEGIILIVFAAFFYSINMVILRKKRASFHWMHTEAVAGLWATFFFTPCYILISHYLFDVPMNELMRFDLSMSEWLLFAAIAIVAFVAIGGITRALQLESVIIVSIILYSEVAFGIIFQWLLLNDTTNFDTFGLWLGLLLVMLSTFLIMYRQNRTKQADVNYCTELNDLSMERKKESYGSVDAKSDLV